MRRLARACRSGQAGLPGGQWDGTGACSLRVSQCERPKFPAQVPSTSHLLPAVQPAGLPAPQVLWGGGLAWGLQVERWTGTPEGNVFPGDYRCVGWEGLWYWFASLPCWSPANTVCFLCWCDDDMLEKIFSIQTVSMNIALFFSLVCFEWVGFLVPIWVITHVA